MSKCFIAVATLLAAAIANYMFVPASYSFALSRLRDLVALLIFTLMGLAFSEVGDLLREAAQERLAAQLPHPRSAVRRTLATTCVRLAKWLDDADRYLSPAESGPEDWVHHSASV